MPDYWWDGTQKQELEAEKPDLSGLVKDVKINGESTIADGVANIIASGNLGIGHNNATGFYTLKATDTAIDGRTNDYAPIVTTNLDYAVKSAMCDGKGTAWTAEEQAAARARMSVENGADFELLADATLEEEANTFTIAFPKPVRECIYHIWFFNSNGASVTAQTQCIEVGSSNYYLLKHTTVLDSRGYVINGYFRYNGKIKTRSIIGYAADSQAESWTTDNPGNGNTAYTNYPTAKEPSKVDGLKFFLANKTHVLNVGAKIQVWGR